MKTASTPPRSSTVHVVDDDESQRVALSRLLRAAGYEVRTYTSAGEFALIHEKELNGCVLLDVRMPGPSGLDLQAALTRRSPWLPIIFVTGHGDIPMSMQAMKAGAADFLTKPVQAPTLLAAVEAALRRGDEQRCALREGSLLRQRFESLTPKEKDIFSRVTTGQPNKQIAAEVAIAERTVKAHRAEVMRKMGAASLAELVRLADALGRTDN